MIYAEGTTVIIVALNNYNDNIVDNDGGSSVFLLTMHAYVEPKMVITRIFLATSDD